MPSKSDEYKLSLPGIDKLIASATRIRFPAGAFGKTCMLVAIFAIACAAIAWAARNPYISGLALVISAVITFYALRRAFDFADKNPSAAILEGTEFVRHEEIRLAAKGEPSLPMSEAIQAEEPEQVELIEDATEANIADEPATETEELES